MTDKEDENSAVQKKTYPASYPTYHVFAVKQFIVNSKSYPTNRYV